MQPLFLVLLTLLLKLPAAGPPAVRVTFRPLTQAAYLKAVKTAVVTKPATTFPLKKVRGRIVIPMGKGPKVFQDITEDTSFDNHEQFEYLGYDTQLKYHLVQDRFNGGYWGWHKVHLIGENGQHLALPGMPVYSPDRQRFVVASSGIEVSCLPNSIQLYRLENGRWQPLWKLEPSVEPATWEPDEIHWLFNSTLLLKKKMWTGKSPGSTFTYAKLTIQ